jgi:hypothetical protein
MQTPSNKPTSVITIIRFKDYAAIKSLFGEADIPETGYTVRLIEGRLLSQRGLMMSDE